MHLLEAPCCPNCPPAPVDKHEPKHGHECHTHDACHGNADHSTNGKVRCGACFLQPRSSRSGLVEDGLARCRLDFRSCRAGRDLLAGRCWLNWLRRGAGLQGDGLSGQHTSDFVGGPVRCDAAHVLAGKVCEVFRQQAAVRRIDAWAVELVLASVDCDPQVASLLGVDAVLCHDVGEVAVQEAGERSRELVVPHAEDLQGVAILANAVEVTKHTGAEVKQQADLSVVVHMDLRLLLSYTLHPFWMVQLTLLGEHSPVASLWTALPAGPSQQP